MRDADETILAPQQGRTRNGGEAGHEERPVDGYASEGHGEASQGRAGPGRATKTTRKEALGQLAAVTASRGTTPGAGCSGYGRAGYQRGNHLVAARPSPLDALERHGELVPDKARYGSGFGNELLAMSAATPPTGR